MPLFGGGACQLNATDNPPLPTPRWGLGDVTAGGSSPSPPRCASAALLTRSGTSSRSGRRRSTSSETSPAGSTRLAPAPLWLVAVLQAFLWLGLLGAPVLAAKTKGNGVVEDFGLRFRPIDVPVGVVIGVASQLVLVPLVPCPGSRPGQGSRRPRRLRPELADKATDPLGVGLLVVIVVGALVVEELFFRGLLQRSLLRRVALAPSGGISALVFGVTHFQLLRSSWPSWPSA